MSNIAETLAAAFGQSYDGRPSYKTMTPQGKFETLSKIVNFLKKKHLSGDSEPYSLDEILEEPELTDNVQIGTRQKNWLENEALKENVRIRVVPPENGDQGPSRYQYKPKIDIRNKIGLRRYLLDKYQAGDGAVWFEDITESLPNAERAIKSLEESGHIIVLTRQDKKQIVFHNEQAKEEERIDEEFVKLWRQVSVDGVPEDKIEDYLRTRGIQSIQRMITQETKLVPKRKVRKPNKNFKAHNEHVKDILQDYTT